MKTYQVYLSQEAIEQLDYLLDYLEVRWSLRVRDNLLAKLGRSVKTISTMPYAFPVSQKMAGIRKCVITPLTIAYYRVKESDSEVEIITIIDSRGNVDSE